MTPQDELKKQAAHKAVSYVKSGDVIGLGTGSTAAFAVDRIGDLLAAGELSDIVGVPTSARTQQQAQERGIPLATLDEQPVLDIAIDGADEVDPALNVVKGRGGALLREKMVERAAKRFVCIVDESKLVDGLGGSKALPEAEGAEVKLRLKPGSSEPYVTDNHNYIADLYFSKPMTDATKLAGALHSIEGVVEHGLFLGMVDICVVAAAGGVKELHKSA
ncbi:ribose 5-phosphate isomerase A [Helicosporidium sp. ATCC 50920]|nr:ribose 5-phosphate isomerase A [Helicosporidium sp. ATCC 50920]|eukprot:KDD74024.1 ribose 5-phosphate isomerase A [Helicosporidium sp. ATCC 50920]